MGGQACIFYGAAEFSRDADLAIAASPTNLTALRRALADLRAEVIAVPPFVAAYLRRGHAVHFRCRDPLADGLRVDVMSRMRGVEAFAKLWSRRTTARLPDGAEIDLLSVPDLVQAKKTQRDKDWPMIRRLVESSYYAHYDAPTRSHVQFWLRELRTPELLVDVAALHPVASRRMQRMRPLLAHALEGRRRELSRALATEEMREREADRRYWKPLRAELESLRYAR